MWRGTSRGGALLLIVALAACTGAGSEGDTPTPSTGANSQAPSGSPSRTVGALPWPVAPTAALPTRRAEPMTAEMRRWVDEQLLPGLTAAVVSPEGVWSSAAGVDGQGLRLEPTSGMALGHLTQTFVAADALLLQERGKLDLDLPASTYVPVPQLANGATTRQLLGHRAGIPDPGLGPYAGVWTSPAAHWSPEQALAPVPKASAPPGEKLYEDSTNYILAGLVIKSASGRSTAVAIDADLWTPLGLDRLAYQDEQVLPEPIAAPGEDTNLPPGQTGRPYLPFRSLASATVGSHNVAGDAASAARWGYALYGGHVLTPQSVAQLTDFDDEAAPGYGMATIDFTTRSWFRWSIPGYGVRAEITGYRGVLAIYPEQQLSVVILTPSKVEVLPYVRHLVKAGGFLD